MRPVVLDLETFFGDDYTLSKMTTEAYVRDPRFEAHGAAIKWSPTTPAVWYDQRELEWQLKNEDWSDVFLVCHHAQFDGFILNHHYGVRPAMWGCTLSMARLLLGNHLSVSLEAVRKHFGIPSKITPYQLFKNKRWSELSPAVQAQIGEGAIDEVESIWRIFCTFMQQGFPAAELDVIDSVIRMFTEPAIVGDQEMLAQIWENEAHKKQSRLDALGVTAGDLQSADRFADLLREQGIEPGTKVSPKGKEIYAFAKTDQFMRDLLEDDSETVQALAQARLGQKSTLMQTRAETLGWMASRGSLCVYLNYAGAGTLRPSGGDGANFLNFKRGSAIRRALCAPEGYFLGPADSSQLECRILHYVAGGTDEPVIQKFRAGDDPYVDLATWFYGEPIYKPKKDDPRLLEMEMKRGVGKQGRLMCGFGAAGKQFKATAKNGLYGPPVDISIEEANRFVAMYRQSNPSICSRNGGLWSICENILLPKLAAGDKYEFGPLEIRDHCIWIQGVPMLYKTLEWHVPSSDEENVKDFEWGGFWRLKTRDGWKKMWGSKLSQNIAEGIESVTVSQAMTRIKRKFGVRSLNWPYDELLLLIPKSSESEALFEACLQEMKLTPSWLPGLPLDAEGSLGERYSK